MPQQTQLLQINPVLQVTDMPASIAFYEEKLGFRNMYDSTQYEEGPVNYAVMCRQNLCIHLQLFDQLAEQPQIRIEVKNIAPLFEEYRNKGVLDHQEALRITPWGTKEFAFFDLNRVGLTFYENN